jgi:undecaprenyl-diphosphatase
MTYLQIVILAIVQGLAELLPVSSSAHVIAAAKLMHLNASDPRFTLLLVMLHTGTMFAVIAYFWSAWKRAFFSSRYAFNKFAVQVVIATGITGIIGLVLKHFIEHYLQRHAIGKAEIEDLFDNLKLIAGALAAAGVVILISSLRPLKRGGRDNLNIVDSIAIGGIQGLCLPFRGFSRSGATISAGLLRGVSKARAEEFSFALAVVLTPVVVALEAKRLIHDRGSLSFHDFTPSLLGMVFSFIAGLVALKVLSKVLANGAWWIFGIYCLLAAGVVYYMAANGY